MALTVTVAVCTFGDQHWRQLAKRRAVPSARAQNVPVMTVHGSSLHGARNEALADCDTDWIIYLDADDELEPGYVQHLTAGCADVRAPAVRYVRGDRAAPPAVPKVAGHTHRCSGECLAVGNWIVVGALVRTALLRDVGGWREWPMYEDWDAWVRCWQAGGTIEAIPAAVYRAHSRPDSRNRAPDRAAKLAAHRAIAKANNLPIP